MESSPFGVVAFQFTALAVSWRGRLNEYQAYEAGLNAIVKHSPSLDIWFIALQFEDRCLGVPPELV